MSGIAELSMLVNDNFDKPLNHQIRELTYSGSYLITASQMFTPDASGWYKIIVVSRGGNSIYGKGGASGAVSIKTLHLDKHLSYEITIDNDNSTNAYTSFQDIICYNATNSSSSSYGNAGTAIGGDFNYNGYVANTIQGKDVGVFIPQLMKATKLTAFEDSEFFDIVSGDGILGYGGGQTQYSTANLSKTENKGGCVLIIPIEIEQ